MSFAKLLGLIGDNEDAMKIAKDLEASTGQLTSDFNNQEIKMASVIESRDKTRTQFNLIKNKFGLEEITAESLATLNTSKPDEAATLEIKNLQDQLAKAVATTDEIESGYKQKLGNLVLKTELNKTGLAQNALNPESYALLESLVLQGATYTEEGQTVFLNPDGSTTYLGSKKMTLGDKVDTLVNNPAYAGLFKPDGQGGGGGPAGSQGGGGNENFSDMSEGERTALYRKNPAEFKKLAESNK